MLHIINSVRLQWVMQHFVIAQARHSRVHPSVIDPEQAAGQATTSKK
jgi:hypothetical protein